MKYREVLKELQESHGLIFFNENNKLNISPLSEKIVRGTIKVMEANQKSKPSK